ncbi:MAG: hypothetical protein AAGG50_13615 [Bacteroidota bacterium]
MPASSRLSALIPRWGALASLLVFSGCAISSGVSQFVSTPVTLPATASSVDLADYEARYPDANGVLLNEEVTYEHEFSATPFGQPQSWVFYQDSRSSYVVLDTDDESLTTFEVRVPSSATLTGLVARVTNPDGSSETFYSDAFATESDDNGTRYKLAYPDVQRGSLVEEAFRLEYKNMFAQPRLNYDIALQFDIPCERVAFRFVMPAAWQTRIKDIAEERAVPYTVELTPDGKKSILTYTATGLPAIEDEIYAPYFKERADYLEFDIALIKAASSTLYEAPTEWEAFADQFKQYAFKRGGFFSDPVKRQTERLIRGEMSKAERLDAIVGWVRDNIDVGSPDNDSFAQVLRDGEGNPYLITGLTQSMLDAASVDAVYLLVHSAQDGHFDPDFVTIAQLYIPALQVTLPDSSQRTIFPYLDKLSTDHVPENFQGQQAMQIDGDGYRGFTTLPYGNAAENAVEERYAVTLREDGVLDVEEERTVRGSLAYVIRTGLEDLTGEERDEFMEELLTYTDGEVLDLAYTIENETDADAPLVVRLTYGIDNLVTLTPEEVLFQTSGLLAPSSRVSRKVDPRERQSAVRIYNDETFAKTITVQYPAGWRLVTPLEEVEVANEFGTLSGRYTDAAGTLTIEQQTTLQRAEAPADAFDTLLTLLGARSELAVPTLVFSTVASE